MTRDQLLQYAKQEKVAKVDVDGYGTFYIRRLNALEWANLYDLHADDRKFSAVYLSLSVCNEKGERYYTEADIDTLVTLPVDLVRALTSKANELNSAPKIKDAEKNS